MQSVLHRVLQPLAFEIVIHLVRRRLTHIQNGFARNVLRSDLVTHEAPPALHWRRASDRRAGAGVGRAVESSVPGFPAAASEIVGGAAADETRSVARLVSGVWSVASAPPDVV